MNKHLLHGGTLTAAQLDELLRLRQQVFVVEQNCAFVDSDGLDLSAWHLWLEEKGKPAAYARLLGPGKLYEEASIGRVATALEYRGTGLGKEVFTEALDRITRMWPHSPVRLMAQTYLEPFYTRYGFEAVGEVFYEDDLPHRYMIKPPLRPK